MIRATGARIALILAVGDLIVYIFSLIITLATRYDQIPSRVLLLDHAPSFSILFVLFMIVSFSLGLFDRQASFVRGRITGLIIKAQLINVFIGAAFFYFAPVNITPKANLFIYFVISTALLFLWRAVMFPVVSATKSQLAIIIGEGENIQDLYEEVNGNYRYGLLFQEKIAPKTSIDETVAAISEAIKRSRASIIVADMQNRTIEAAMPFLYSLIFSGAQIIDAGKLYESVFDRVPLSLVGERWLVENTSISLGNRRVYDGLKRVLDIIVASICGLISLIFYPLVYFAVKLDDAGDIFIFQERVGKNGKPIKIAKFRSMSADDGGSYYNNGGKSKLKVTRVGKFIRLTRIDELPQLWSVIKGDQSLIGPRPELPSLVSIYEKEIPYYNVRHLIKPGLSGWAQIYHRAHPHHAVAIDDTRDKLSYDLYYVKNRSLGLDLRIALQTARAMLSRQGV